MNLEPLLSFKHVSAFANEEFGLSRISFDLYEGQTYVFKTPTKDRQHTLLKLLEGGLQPDTGRVEKSSGLFFQSDRQLLGDKAYFQEASKWLALDDPYIFFEEKNRTKEAFLDSLKANHIRHFPIYKLRGKDKIKFALLAMLFQEKGLIYISRFLEDLQPGPIREMFLRFARHSSCALCFFVSEDQKTTFEPSEFIRQDTTEIHCAL